MFDVLGGPVIYVSVCARVRVREGRRRREGGREREVYGGGCVQVHLFCYIFILILSEDVT